MSVAWSGTTLKPLSQMDAQGQDQSPLFSDLPEPEPEPEQLELELEMAAGTERGYEMAVICPEGVGVGEAVLVTTSSPRAREVEAVVPEGVEPGDEFTIFVEEPPPVDAEDAEEARRALGDDRTGPVFAMRESSVLSPGAIDASRRRRFPRRVAQIRHPSAGCRDPLGREALRLEVFA